MADVDDSTLIEETHRISNDNQNGHQTRSSPPTKCSLCPCVEGSQSCANYRSDLEVSLQESGSDLMFPR